MEDFSSGQSRAAMGAESAMNAIGDPFDMLNPDDPLGDEAAFPSTWQQLDSGDSVRD